ncbi:FecR family protein [Fibrivirga algicola]|nr:FecR domain-containing protein [Fibrivirga algicola]
MAEPITRQTLFLFFEGRATALQRKLIEDWLKDPANEELYYASLEAWERQHPQLPDDTTEAETRFFTYLRKQKPAEKPTLSPAFNPVIVRSFWRNGLLAASVFLALLAGLGILFQDTIRYQHYTTDFGETRSLQLTDGSRVTLNANSELKVPRWLYGQADREVWLTGEAEFMVTHTVDHRRFVVRTRSDLSVDVLGTVFSVYDRGTKAAVSLLKGKVNVRYGAANAKQQVITLKPGNQITLNEGGHLALTPRVDPQVVSAWKNHQFVFDNSTLTEVLQLVQENYGVTVRLSDARFGQKRVSGTFTAQSATELLSVLAEIYSLKLQPDQDDFLLIAPAPNPSKSISIQ